MKSLDKRQLFKNLLAAFAAQGAAVGASLLTTLLLPKVLGVSEYGYWQLFIFYCSYAGLFHFGISEGVYLLNGGKLREELDLASLKSQLVISVVLQLCFIFGVLILVNNTVTDSNRFIIFISTAIYIILNNTSYYLGYIFQSINDTKKFSISIMIDRCVFIVPLIISMIFNVTDFRIYIILYIISKLCSLGYCMWEGSYVLSAKCLSIRSAVSDSLGSIRVGIKLMLANLMGSLIVGSSRVVIDYAWGIETFGKLSLSLSMVNFFLQFIAQFSMVLFPALKRVDSNNLIPYFNMINNSLSLILPIIYFLYLPLYLFIYQWLPEYADSLRYLAILLPLCVFDGKMNVCFSTFLKVLRKEKFLFIINAVSLLLSISLSLTCGFVLHSPVLVVVSASISVVVRSIISELYVSRLLCTPRSLMSLGEILIASFFTFTAFLGEFTILFLGLCLGYSLFVIRFHEQAKLVINKIANIIYRYND